DRSTDPRHPHRRRGGARAVLHDRGAKARSRRPRGRRADVKTYRRLLGYLAPYRGRLALAILAMVLLAATTGLYPILLDLLTTFLVDGEAGARKVLDPALERLGRFLAFTGADLEIEPARTFVEANFLVLFGFVVMIKAGSQAVRFYEMGMIAQHV